MISRRWYFQQQCGQLELDYSQYDHRWSRHGNVFWRPDGGKPFIAGLVENNLIMNTIGYNVQFKQQNPWPNVSSIPIGKTRRSSATRFQQRFSSSGGDSAAQSSCGSLASLGPDKTTCMKFYGNVFYQNPVEALFQGEGNIAFHHNF